MKTILKIFIHLGWYKITTDDLAKWKAARSVILLRLALRKGTYKVRREAAKILGKLKDSGSIVSLAKAAKDEVRSVAEAAISALHIFLPNKEVETLLVSADAHWAEQDRIAEGWKN